MSVKSNTSSKSAPSHVLFVSETAKSSSGNVERTTTTEDTATNAATIVSTTLSSIISEVVSPTVTEVGANAPPETPPPTPTHTNPKRSFTSVLQDDEEDLIRKVADVQTQRDSAVEGGSAGDADDEQKQVETRSSTGIFAESLIQDILKGEELSTAIEKSQHEIQGQLHGEESVEGFLRGILEDGLRETLDRMEDNEGEKRATPEEVQGKSSMASSEIMRRSILRKTSSKGDEKHTIFSREHITDGQVLDEEESEVYVSSDMGKCSFQIDIETTALKLLERVIKESMYKAFKIREYNFGEDGGECSPSSSLNYLDFIGSKVTVMWPSAEEFTVELGKQSIDEYMCTWNLYEEWMYCTDFLIAQSDESSDFYLYESKWSIPTKPYPIPQAYAAIYFIVEVSRVKPKKFPVEVSYMLEGNRYLHTPGKIEFKEKWLFNIIDSKLKFYKKLRF